MREISKLKGALYGAAVGDALGAPLEFMAPEQIVLQYGTVKDMVGGGWLHTAPGEGTDETALMLACAYGIIKNPTDPYAEIGKNYINWAISRPRDISDTTLRSIDRTMAKAHGKYLVPKARWQESAQQVDVFSNRGSIDNGAIVNMVYPALYYSREDEAVPIALDIANMTHANTQSNNACRLYTQLLFRIFNRGIDKKEMDELIDSTMYYRYKKEYVLPTACAHDSIVSMLHAFMETENFEEALIRAVNYGGDSDTIGAMTGGLAGCFYGFEAIPQRWLDALPSEIKQMLDEICAAIK